LRLCILLITTSPLRDGRIISGAARSRKRHWQAGVPVDTLQYADHENPVETMADGIAAEFLRATREAFQQQRKFSERAIAQLDDDALFRTSGSEGNSIAVLMKHVGGNLRSRWTEPLTTDGEKPDRDRDSEFVTEADSAASVRAVWERGWSALEQTLDTVRAEDLERTITVRGESLTFIMGLQRSLAHTAQHAGQIILLAKQWKGAEWKTLTIGRGESATYKA
jgi:uncharacterized damage-inducible protein DinB